VPEEIFHFKNINTCESQHVGQIAGYGVEPVPKFSFLLKTPGNKTVNHIGQKADNEKKSNVSLPLTFYFKSYIYDLSTHNLIVTGLVPRRSAAN
jgi:hypothetical protein